MLLNVVVDDDEHGCSLLLLLFVVAVIIGVLIELLLFILCWGLFMNQCLVMHGLGTAIWRAHGVWMGVQSEKLLLSLTDLNNGFLEIAREMSSLLSHFSNAYIS